MDTTVGRGVTHANIGWSANFDFGDCDFGDNRVGKDSYFDEADMNS
jgi:hypothetical protein